MWGSVVAGTVVAGAQTVRHAGRHGLGPPVPVSRWRPALRRRSGLSGPVVSGRGRNVRRMGWPQAHLRLVGAPVADERVRPKRSRDRRDNRAGSPGLAAPWHRRCMRLTGPHARRATRAVRAETEMLSDGADALYVSKGLSQVFAEDVMQLREATHLPLIQVPADAEPVAVGSSRSCPLLCGLPGGLPRTTRIPRMAARALDRVDQ